MAFVNNLKKKKFEILPLVFIVARCEGCDLKGRVGVHQDREPGEAFHKSISGL